MAQSPELTFVTQANLTDPASPVGAALSATIATAIEDAGAGGAPLPAVTFSSSQPISGGTTQVLGVKSPVTYLAGDVVPDANGVKTALSAGQLGVRFTVYGRNAAVRMYCQSNVSRVQVKANGHLVTPRTGENVPGAAVAAVSWVRLSFATDGPHTVEVTGHQVYWHSVSYDGSGAITPAPESVGGPRLVVVGDSWVGGAAGVGVPTTWAAQLGELLGIPQPWLAGQGGTGYVNTGPGADGWTQDYGDPKRLNAVIAANPTDVLVFGSINDGGSTETHIRNAATAYFTALVAALPDVRLHVFLPQPTTVSQQSAAAQVANRRAVRAAAEAAANVYTIVDGVTDGWFTDGNRSRFLGPDLVHMTQEGHDYLARIVAAKIAPALNGSPALEPPTEVVLAADTFTRADGPLGSTETGSLPWITSNGTVTVKSNQLSFDTKPGVAEAGPFALVDTGETDVSVEVTATSSTVGPAIRCTANQENVGPASGFVLYSASNLWVLRRRDEYGTFVILSNTGKAFTVGQVAKLTASGNTITAYVNGEQIAQVTDPAHNTNTHHGVTTNNAGKTADNFTVTTI